jgi:hypothetical protein
MCGVHVGVSRRHVHAGPRWALVWWPPFVRNEARPVAGKHSGAGFVLLVRYALRSTPCKAASALSGWL